MKTKKVNFGDLKVGDKIMGSDGPVTVTNVYDKHLPDKMYEIEMENGEVIRASGNHLWYCETEDDLANKEAYKQLAQGYFKNNNIPKKLKEDESYPLRMIIKMFGDNVLTQVFIEQVCRSLGYSSYTTHIITEDWVREITKEDIYNYSYNDLIDFLRKMEKAVMLDKGYFYFGKVRTTNEIAEIMSHNIYVSIPHKGKIDSE